MRNVFKMAIDFFKRRRLRIGGAFLLLLLGMVALFLFCPMDTRLYLDSNPSPQILDRSGTPLYFFLNKQNQWAMEKGLDEIDAYLTKATIAVEDHRFFKHHGVDMLAVSRAVFQNLFEGRIASGASTITMQVVKISRKMKRRIPDKIIQAWLALRLERRATKNQIIQAYLNKAPYGMNLVGCESAAWRYWGKSAKELTLPEAALLAGLPRSPTYLNPLKYPERAIKRRNFVLSKMLKHQLISQSEYESAVKTPVNVRWHSFTHLAPHTSLKLKNKLGSADYLQTTLDYEIQKATEENIRDHLKKLESGLNAAAIIIDVSTAEVLARVGSSDYFSGQKGCRVDCSASPRSPGSALKPFIYALAMDNNQLYPCEILMDSPTDFGLYSPENYNRDYAGRISATLALQRSLNIPAVKIIERLGTEKALSFFRRTGLSTLNQTAEHYGLGLALGDCEVRLDELAAAYLMLANLGSYRQPQIIKSYFETPEMRILSRSACVKLFEMLESPVPVEFSRMPYKTVTMSTRLCWKTGTSSQKRDAWAFVFNRHYVVGVWLGKTQSGSSPDLVGADAALPLALRIFRGLKPKASPDFPDIQNSLSPVKMCAHSGLPASAECLHTMIVYIPANQSIARKCVTCLDARRTRMSDNPLKILHPVQGAEFILTGEINGDRIRLKSSLEGRDKIHWYQDGKYLGASDSGSDYLLTLAEGLHKLSCMNSSGDTAQINYRVISPSDIESKNKFK